MYIKRQNFVSADNIHTSYVITTTPMSFKNIFFTGATGYIGGTILTKLIKTLSTESQSYNINVLVRQQEKADILDKLAYPGVKSIVGSLDDLPAVESYAANADIFISTADADGLDAMNAILKGFKTRFEKTGVAPILIHTSGTGVYTDDPKNWLKGLKGDVCYTDLPGGHPGCKLVSDLAPTQMHRDVDLAILAAADAGYVKSYIVLPSTIWGIWSGPLVDAKFQNPHSQQIPGLIKQALSRGAAGTVGKGENVWPHVKISDVTDIYILIFQKVTSGQAIPHGKDGFYNGENGQYQYLAVAEEIAKQIHSLDSKSYSAKVSPFTSEEIEKNSLSYYGSNSLCHSGNSRAIGWSPKGDTKEFFESIKTEIIALRK